MVSPKRWLLSAKLNGVTFQDTTVWT